MERTFDFDNALPKLPLPELEDTLQRFLGILLPYCTAEEKASVEQEVSRLLRYDGADAVNLLKAQSLLRERHKALNHYCLDWWNETYLTHRGPLIPSESMVPHYPNNGDQLETAARVVYSATDVFLRLRHQLLPPHTSRSQKLTMAQYKNLFCTYRKPGELMDETIHKFQTLNVQEKAVAFDEPLGSVLIGCNSQFFMLPLATRVEHSTQSRRLQLHEIKACFDLIYAAANSSDVPKGYQVGALTAGPRQGWAAARKILEEHQTNRESLAKIEEAIFAVHLDPEKPEKPEDRLKESAIGTHIGTRWFDIGMQFVVFANGKASYIMEHSSLDALPAFWVQEEVYRGIEMIDDEDAADQPSPTIDAKFTMQHVVPLKWHVSEKLSSYIAESHNKHSEIWKNWCVRVKRLHGVGSRLIKSTELSPDSFVQVAFQLAFFRLYKFVPSVYESVVTTRFRNSRTETGRSVTVLTNEFIQAFDSSPQATVEMKDLFTKAVHSHANFVSEARTGKGVDRHVFALRQVAELEGIQLPELLREDNKLFRRASCWDLSTSHVTSPLCASHREHGTAFHPVGIESIGIVYGIYPDYVDFTIMTDRRSTKFDGDIFLEAVFKALFDLLHLILPASAL